MALNASSEFNKMSAQLRAAQGLLERYEPWEKDDDLSALHLLLHMIEGRANELRQEMFAASLPRRMEAAHHD